MTSSRVVPALAGVVVAVLALAGCGGAQPQAATPAVVTVTAPPPTAPTVTITAEPPAAEPTIEPTPAPEPSPKKKPPAEKIEPQAETFTMPALVGRVLQDAQDLLQTKGSYLMDQQDATGLERLQVLDANWKVCSQSPKKGTVVATDTMVVLRSVKLVEECPQESADGPRVSTTDS
jgi:hypothetical protein